MPDQQDKRSEKIQKTWRVMQKKALNVKNLRDITKKKHERENEAHE